MTTGYVLDGRGIGVRLQAGASASGPYLDTPSILLVSIEGSFLRVGVKLQGLKADRLLLSSAEVKRAGTMFLLSQYIFMVCYLIR